MVCLVDYPLKFMYVFIKDMYYVLL